MRGVCANAEKSTAVLIRNLYRTKIVCQNTEIKMHNDLAPETHTITELRDEIQVMTRAGLMIKPSAHPSG